MNALGTWGRVASSEMMTIKKPYWKQAWFLGLMVIVFFAVIYGVQSALSEHKYAVRLKKQVEERTAQLQESLKEKDVLLKEVHHRVKNNFAVVSSLLNLQSNSVEDERTRHYLHESSDRIRSMALVRERLYQAENVTNIRFSEYIMTLSEELTRSHRIDPNRITITMDVDDIPLSVDQAIPCGLIVNELITNALKYAFPGSYEGRGEIVIELHRKGDRSIELVVRDNGVGIPADIDLRNNGSLGLSLVFLLAESQLGGSVRVEREEGTCFRIVFDTSVDS
jgi:two-component sensor histidine kinase